MTIIGIDPGLSGAIAFIAPSGALEVHDMPTVPGAKGGNEIDFHELFAILSGWEATAWCELVHAMPGNGSKSAFKLGQTFGAIRMALAAACIPVRFVTPPVWKRHFRLSKDKGVARGEAMRRFPANAESFRRVKDDGRAESALIALYGAESTTKAVLTEDELDEIVAEKAAAILRILEPRFGPLTERQVGSVECAMAELTYRDRPGYLLLRTLAWRCVDFADWFEMAEQLYEEPYRLYLEGGGE